MTLIKNTFSMKKLNSTKCSINQLGIQKQYLPGRNISIYRFCFQDFFRFNFPLDFDKFVKNRVSEISDQGQPTISHFRRIIQFFYTCTTCHRCKLAKYVLCLFCMTCGPVPCRSLTRNKVKQHITPTYRVYELDDDG